MAEGAFVTLADWGFGAAALPFVTLRSQRYWLMLSDGS